MDLRHDAFVYDSPDRFLEQVAPFLEAGLGEEASTVAVTTEDRCDLLREALGKQSDRVSFIESNSWYLRPATAIAGYHATLQRLARAGAPSVRVVGEGAFGSAPEGWNEWSAYESILKRTFAAQKAWIVCPYDASVLPAELIES